MGTGNPKEQNDLTGLYPRDPLYPPLFSDDGGLNAVDALAP
jgi:hypothetical protein